MLLELKAYRFLKEKAADLFYMYAPVSVHGFKLNKQI
jgi:hypothetical protein